MATTTTTPVDVSNCKWNLREGNGEFIYEIGGDENNEIKTDEELEKAIADFTNAVVETLNCEVSVICKQTGKKGKRAHLLVREANSTDKYVDLRMAVCGNVDAGKTTLVGVLTSGHLDNGRGAARASIFKHKHEIETGRTSAISEQILGFDSLGNCVNYESKRGTSWGDIMEKSFKVVSFVDLAGHEKYIKTTVSGLIGTVPDYALLLVGANMGVTRMTKEHFGLALGLNIPVIVVVTKIDMAPENVKKETLAEVSRTLKMKGVKKMPLPIRNDEDLLTAIKTIQSNRVVPIFEVSSVTGENLDLLRKFLNLVPPRIQWELLQDKPAEVVIDQTWSIAGVGTVVGGTVIGGTVRDGQTLLLGPDGTGNFKPVTVKSLHTNHVPAGQVGSGRSVGVALKRVKRSEIRRGMVLVDPAANPRAVREFEATVVVLHHATSIKKNYEPVIQCLGIRQAARIVDIAGKDILRVGDRAQVRFRFCYRPEYIKPGIRIIFREGRCKGIGVISSIDFQSAPTDGGQADMVTKLPLEMPTATTASTTTSTPAVNVTMDGASADADQ